MSGKDSHSLPHVEKVGSPAVLYGFIGIILATVVYSLGFFKGLEDKLVSSLELYLWGEGELYYHFSTLGLILVCAAFCLGLSFTIMDSCGYRKHVFVTVSAILVVLVMVPTLAVWDIYFSPFLPLTGIIWTCFCSFVYVRYHSMPCDRFITSPTQKES